MYTVIIRIKDLNVQPSRRILLLIDYNIDLLLLLVILWVIVKFVRFKNAMPSASKNGQIVMYLLRQVGPVIFIAGLIVLHDEYSIITIEKEARLSVIFSILTMYGIFYGFIQFTLNYARGNKKDKYWGRSITKFLLAKNVWFIIFNSLLFKLMLIYIVIVPFIYGGKARLPDILNDPLLLVIWDVSVVGVVILYVLLFIKSLSIMNAFFSMQEGLGFHITSRIQKEVKQEFGLSFIASHKNESNFRAILFEKVRSVEKQHQKEMFKGVITYVLQTDIKVEKKDRHISTHHYLKMFRNIFSSGELKKLDLNVDELLMIYRSMEHFIHSEVNNYKKGDINRKKEIIDLYTDGYRLFQTNDYFDVPKIIWEQVRAHQDILDIQEYVATKASKIPLTTKSIDQDELRILNKSYARYVSDIINYSSHYVEEIKNRRIPYQSKESAVFRDTETNSDIVIYEIYDYLMNTTFSNENKPYIQLLMSALSYKEQVAFIFYMILYPNPPVDISQNLDVLFLQKVINENKEIDGLQKPEVKEHVIDAIINDDRSYLSHINHRIGRALIKRIFDHIDDYTSDIEFVKMCIDEKFLTYLKMLKMKFIFNEIHYNYVNFNGFPHGILKQQPMGDDWRLDFYVELLETPELFKVEFFRRHIYELFKNITFSSMPQRYLAINDFRLYLLSRDFHITEQDFRELIRKRHYVSEGIVAFLLLRIDEKPYEYLYKQKYLSKEFSARIITNMSNHNVHIEGYLLMLAEALDEIDHGSLLTAMKKEKIIKILGDLV